MQKKWILRIAAIALVLCMMLGLALTAAATYPKHNDYIYDGAGVLSSATIQSIKSTNDSLSQKAGAKIVVCVVESLGGQSIDAYARGIFDDWNPGDCVLLLVTTGEADYFAIQSVRIASVLNNEQLDAIMKEFMEPDFATGDIERGIHKTVNKLSGFLKTALAEAPATERGNEPVTIGSVVLSLLKIIGWSVLILVLAFVIFFVVALFNDTAAELMNRFVFSRFTGKSNNGGKGSSRAPVQNYYDERLYGKPRNNGNPQQRSGNPGRRAPSSQSQNQMYDRYRQGNVRYDEEYYGWSRNGAGGQARQPSANRPQSNPQRAPRQPRGYADDGYTRQFSINDLNRK